MELQMISWEPFSYQIPDTGDNNNNDIMMIIYETPTVLPKIDFYFVLQTAASDI